MMTMKTFAAGLLLASTLMTLQAHADDRIEASYAFSVSGVPVLDIDYAAAISGNDFALKASVKTKGMAGLFSDYRMKMNTAGSLHEGEPQPVEFSSRTEKEDKTRKVDLAWSEDGTPKQIRSDYSEAEFQPGIDAALKPEVVDLLTAMLRAGLPGEGSPCGSTQRVYDGRDIYDLKFTLQKQDTLGEDSDGVYRGPVHVCQMTYTPIEGRGAAKFKRRKMEPLAFKVWFAPVQSSTLGGQMYVPVRATGELEGKSFVAYARSAKLNQQPLNTSSLMGD